MEITQQNEDKRGTFKATENGAEAGHITYTWAGADKFIIDHTDVDPAFKGKNVGKQLVLKAVEYARENKLKIMPLCPFAKSVFDRNAELQDVLF
ncbi:GNAT family N-acetyltransferase [Pedobacter namyangjuensis]|uniref:GNAT family N-acetyltransferase n=1 Tax=Pedobacter namyangjuensis TaxID=600626 RepID=UPI000DE3BD4A|nr:GNAT family N-acetyltransferase [Pedobacter namyangjuensis]